MVEVYVNIVNNKRQVNGKSLLHQPKLCRVFENISVLQYKLPDKCLETNTSRVEGPLNLEKCNSCMLEKLLLVGKLFCSNCDILGVECIHCHKSRSTDFIKIVDGKCGRCYRKYNNRLAAKKKRLRLRQEQMYSKAYKN